ELRPLRLRALVLDVELGGILQQWVSPAQNGRPGVALRDIEAVHGGIRRLDSLEAHRLPCGAAATTRGTGGSGGIRARLIGPRRARDRKSTRLNSSHV